MEGQIEKSNKLSGKMIALMAAASGVTSVIPQLLLPLCAKLSDEHVRGKNIGHIMSGLLTGVVLSRVVSGSVGKYLGWKSIYMIAVIFISWVPLVHILVQLYIIILDGMAFAVLELPHRWQQELSSG